MRTSRSSEMRQSKSIEIPIYKAKVETAEGKMDRISKYIASLKSIMTSI
jgi:predicted translin family RNA/ssDNA-binding protein